MFVNLIFMVAQNTCFANEKHQKVTEIQSGPRDPITKKIPLRRTEGHREDPKNRGAAMNRDGILGAQGVESWMVLGLESAIKSPATLVPVFSHP